MATFLEIAKSAHRKLRGGNAQPGSQPVTIPIAPTPVVDQIVYDIVDAVQQAWINIQNLHDEWLWMSKTATFPLVNGQRTYTVAQIRAAITDYDRLQTMDAGTSPSYIFVYDSGAATRVDQRCFYVDWENWHGYADARPYQTAMPARFTEQPDFTLQFDPTPNTAPSGSPWAVQLDYKRTNQALSISVDVPQCPDKYHELIAWMAVILVCETRQTTGMLLSLANREVYGDQRQAGRLEMMERDQLPPMLLDTRYAQY